MEESWKTIVVAEIPVTKFYMAALLILLIATATIIGVFVSQHSTAYTKDYATASYNEAQILPLPDDSQPRFASSEFLIVGALDAECNSQESS